jgi:DNA-binding LacI/PurR family transcriptional regulator
MKSSGTSQQVNTTLALAQHLGLSRWTVSRALNGHPGVREETAQRVRKAMDRLGFSPNALARGLRGGKTQVVGICFQTFGTPVFSKKLIALQSALRRKGYRAIIELIEEDAEAEKAVIRHFASLQVEGVIFVGGPSKRNLPLVSGLRESSSIAALLIDPVESVDLPQIRLDRGHAMKISMKRLHEQGHRKVAIMGVRDDVIYGAERVEALKAICHDLGMEWGSDAVLFNDDGSKGMDFEAGRRLGSRFVKERKGATGILAINDQVAIGAMRSLQEVGTRIPDDVSIIGFDNLDCSQHLHPSLASVDQRIEFVAQAAVDELVRYMQQDGDGVANSECRWVKPKFAWGESLGKGPGN